MKTPPVLVVLLFAVPPPGPSASAEPELARLIETIRNVGPEGRGNLQASAAWRRLVREGRGASLVALLKAMHGANPLAVNWIRGAIDAIAERALLRGEELPAAQLERFVSDLSETPRARRLAFEWLARTDPAAADRLIPTMLHDPGVEFRRDAVGRLLVQAERAQVNSRPAEAIALYTRALDTARDLDQIQRSAKRLRELGETVDLPRHFGFLMDWRLLGPFDNREKLGFDRPYPPELGIDLGAEYEGKAGRVRWIDHTTGDEYGNVDLNKALGRDKGVLAYALSEFIAGEPRDVELRLATVNAWKLWLNGELLFSRNEYHHGTQLDHYRVRGRLRAGRNLILLKVCQNEQTQDYADVWRFQLRVCDATGTAVLSTARHAEGTGAGRRRIRAHPKDGGGGG